MALALLKVLLMNFILRISKEVKWKVEASMDNFLKQFICTWDPFHKGGIVDNHIRGESSFS